MAEQNLILNILTFNHPVVKKDFAFYTEKKNGCLPINHYEFPLNIEEIIPDAKTQKLQQLYTDFENTSDKEAVISVDLTKCTNQISIISLVHSLNQSNSAVLFH